MELRISKIIFSGQFHGYGPLFGELDADGSTSTSIDALVLDVEGYTVKLVASDSRIFHRHNSGASVVVDEIKPQVNTDGEISFDLGAEVMSVTNLMNTHFDRDFEGVVLSDTVKRETIVSVSDSLLDRIENSLPMRFNEIEKSSTMDGVCEAVTLTKLVTDYNTVRTHGACSVRASLYVDRLNTSVPVNQVEMVFGKTPIVLYSGERPYDRTDEVIQLRISSIYLRTDGTGRTDGFATLEINGTSYRFLDKRGGSNSMGGRANNGCMFFDDEYPTVLLDVDRVLINRLLEAVGKPILEKEAGESRLADKIDNVHHDVLTQAMAMATAKEESRGRSMEYLERPTIYTTEEQDVGYQVKVHQFDEVPLTDIVHIASHWPSYSKLWEKVDDGFVYVLQLEGGLVSIHIPTSLPPHPTSALDAVELLLTAKEHGRAVTAEELANVDIRRLWRMD